MTHDEQLDLERAAASAKRLEVAEVLRGEGGRFLPGTAPGPGQAGRDRRADRTARRRAYFQVVCDEVPIDEWRAIVRKQRELAKIGNRHAVRFLADYLLPRPKPTVNVAVSGKMEVEQRRVDVLAVLGDPVKLEAACRLLELLHGGPGGVLAGGTGDPREPRPLEAGAAPGAPQP